MPKDTPSNLLWPIWLFLLQISSIADAAISPPHTLASFLSHGRVNDWLRLPKEGGAKGEWLMLGAVNRLYVLDAANLSLAHETVTGPVLDSPFCNSELTSCIGPRESIVEMDTWSKLLIPLATKSAVDALLICGSTRQGECHLRQFPSLERLQRHPLLSGHWQHIPVAANAPESSSSALLAGDRLFVASTSSHEESPYRETFPAVATRLLSDGLQPVHAGSLDGEAAVHIRTEFRSRLRVRYLLSFRDQFFVYWLAVQPKSPHSGSPLVTRLIRICLEDDRYTSYSELELQCRNGEDNALFGVAKAGQIQQGGEQLWTIFADSEGQRSAICAFPLAKIRLTFWYNIDRCRGGADSIGLPHINRDAKCTNRSHLPLSEDTCLLGVGGSIEASAPALAIFDDEITALDVAELDGHLLLAAGTQSGQVLQMEAIGDRANRRMQKYADFRAAADPIQRIAILGEQQKLLVAADKEVLLLRLSICDDNNNGAGGGNCTNCLNAGDPLCAWCFPLGRCTRPSACPSQAILHQCPRPIGPLIPENISISARFPGPILLPIVGLPSNGQFDLECIFGQTGLRSRARLRPEGVECPLPRERLRMGPSSRHQEAIKMSMALRAVGTQMDLVAFGSDQKEGIGEGGLTLYACDAHKLCSACANSPWPCRWCATQRKCVDAVDFGSQCPREARGQPIGCARILPFAPGFELLVPADSAAKNISLEFAVENLSSQLPLGCRIAGGQIHLASILDGKVRCVPGQQVGGFDDDQNVGIKNLTLELLAGDEPVDATIVSVYKCANLASDCSRCVGLDPRFACSWCEGGCRHSDRCPRRSAGALAADELCTAPAIHSFSPKSGPIEGGTLVEIRGRDLGSKQQDIQDRVRVAGIPCRVIDYEVSERIICRTGPTTQSAEGEMAAGPIRITIGRSGRRSVESPSQLGHFQYRNPQPRSVQPAFGPKSGGTRLDIFGQFLDVGTNVSVHLDNIECEIRERMSDQLSCLTGPSPRPYTVTAIRLQFDGAIRLISGAKFEYRPDPTVRDIQPRMVPESGGRNLTVFGTNFDSILAPKLFLLSPPIVAGANADEWELISELGACQVENATQMRCQSPRLALPTALLRQSQMARWTVGFAMDGVKPVQNLGPTMQLTTVPDPQFSPFAAGVHQLQPDQPLMLTGQWLNQAAEPEEFWVGIGQQRCPVFLLEPDRLLCRPPPTPPLPTDDSGVEMADGRPLVVVRIGRSRAEIGALEYAQSGKAGAPIWTGRMAAGAILAFLALAMALAGLGWIWRRRQGEHERTYRRIQLQMEQMESQVRQECKQAFAELQIDVLSELDGSGNGADESTNSLGTINGGTFGASSIPLLDRREFLARLLLRDSADPAVLASFGGCGGGGIYSSQLPMALAQFDALLWNRPFLYVLVQMAEEDTSIGAAERSMLSSLLLVALSRNWAFASDVVLSLLSAHIQRCIHTNQAHLLFRHSDSLVEKLFQNWLTISLLPWLHCPSKGPTRPFFLLYRALKSLTEKGPIDAVTGQARYSLSELSLLREPIEPVQLTLLVVPLDGFDQAPVKVRALDCDTIGQLKAKLLDTLYRNVPFSQRIGHDQFDLEWRCPRRGAVLLLDDDQPQQRAPRPLNTLTHYAVPDLALLAMQSRPMAANQQFTFRSGSSDHSSSFTLGWRSSANQLLSASSSSSSSDSSPSPPSAQQSSSHSDSVYFHICPPHFIATSKKTSKSAENGSKRLTSSTSTTASTQPILPEVLLTRLLMCKSTLQRFVDAFIQSVQFADGQSVPTVLKYVFDFLDAQAEQHPKSIDEDILHAWKSNCWVLRFWQQILHNPDLLFDVPRQPCLAGSLAVLGQTLVDSFSRADLALGKESPSSKLLFAREIAKYRPFADELFRRIRAQPPMSSQHFYDYAATLSKLASDGLSSRAALNELLNWSKGNGLRLVECLNSDPEARRLRLGDKLRQIVESSLLESEKPIGGPDEHVYASIR